MRWIYLFLESHVPWRAGFSTRQGGGGGGDRGAHAHRMEINFLFVDLLMIIVMKERKEEDWMEGKDCF